MQKQIYIIENINSIYTIWAYTYKERNNRKFCIMAIY